MTAFLPLFHWIASLIPAAILAGLWLIVPGIFYGLLAGLFGLWVVFPWAGLLWAPSPAFWAPSLAANIWAGMWRCSLIIPFSFVAPLVVPVALLFAARTDEKLPAVFRFWDNDVSINGDQGPDAPTYYCPGWDRRSYGARLVWLLRNRCSWMAQDLLGHKWQGWELSDRQSWGDIGLASRDREGVTVNRAGAVMQLYCIWKIPGLPLCFRLNMGYKVWAAPGDGRPIASAVHIPWSILRWRG